MASPSPSTPPSTTAPSTTAPSTTLPTTTPSQPAAASGGDSELMRRLLEQGEIDTRREAAGVGDYFFDLWSALYLQIARLLENALPGLAPWLRWLDAVLPWILGAFALLAVTLLTVKIWRARRTAPAVDVEIERPSMAPERDASAWDATLRARLAAGDLHGALEALWWWLAGRLGAARADASWTARELVTRSGRRDLLPWVQRFDRLAYGTRSMSREATDDVSIEDVSTLWHELDGRVEPAEETR
ncbi:MAG: hypothetical protein AAGC60_14665 [Acidobacteriota bacterium]